MLDPGPIGTRGLDKIVICLLILKSVHYRSESLQYRNMTDGRDVFET